VSSKYPSFSGHLKFDWPAGEKKKLEIEFRSPDG